MGCTLAKEDAYIDSKTGKRKGRPANNKQQGRSKGKKGVNGASNGVASKAKSQQRNGVKAKEKKRSFSGQAKRAKAEPEEEAPALVDRRTSDGDKVANPLGVNPFTVSPPDVGVSAPPSVAPPSGAASTNAPESDEEGKVKEDTASPAVKIKRESVTSGMKRRVSAPGAADLQGRVPQSPAGTTDSSAPTPAYLSSTAASDDFEDSRKSSVASSNRKRKTEMTEEELAAHKQRKLFKRINLWLMHASQGADDDLTAFHAAPVADSLPGEFDDVDSMSEESSSGTTASSSSNVVNASASWSR